MFLLTDKDSRETGVLAVVGVIVCAQARGGHRDVQEVARWAGPLSNVSWAA